MEEVREAASPDRDANRLRNGLIWTGALLALLLAIGLAVPDLREVLDKVTSASPLWVVLAVALELVSCLGYVIIVRLVLWRGPKREVRRLAWAEMAFGAVVPVGGAGGLAVGAWALRAFGLSWSRIANRSAVIFLLTSAVNAGVLAIASAALIPSFGWKAIVPAAVSIGGIAFFMLLPQWSDGRLARWVRDTREVAFRPNWRLLGAIGYLLFDIAVLWACLRAFGAHVPVLALIVGYQIGYLANLVPIPGGVGVLEGGLLAALLLYGLPVAPTAAAVILYHAIALWVPTLGGTIGFVRLRGAVAARSRGDGVASVTPMPAVNDETAPSRLAA